MYSVITLVRCVIEITIMIRTMIMFCIMKNDHLSRHSYNVLHHRRYRIHTARQRKKLLLFTVKIIIITTTTINVKLMLICVIAHLHLPFHICHVRMRVLGEAHWVVRAGPCGDYHSLKIMMIKIIKIKMKMTIKMIKIMLLVYHIKLILIKLIRMSRRK